MELASIYSEYHKVLLNFIKTKVQKPEDAEDILQNVFVKVATGIVDLNRKEKLVSWIFAITRNTIIDYYRSNTNKNSGIVAEDIFESISDEEYDDTTKGLDCCLMKFVNQLPEEYRDIIVEVEMKGIKQKDLALKYELAYPSIKSRVQRGREKLKQILLACCDIEWDSRGNILDVQSKSTCGSDSSTGCKN